VAELFIFGPPLVLGTIIALLGRRYVLGADLTRREAWLTAGLAGLAGAAAFLAFAFEWLLYAVGEHEGEYYDFSTYMEYRHALDSWTGFVAAIGFGLLAAGLALAAGVLWRRVHPVAGLVLAAAACVAVVLPWELPSRLDRVEYGQDAVLHPVRRSANCFKFSVEGVYPAPPESRMAPILCLRFQRADHAMNARKVADQLNDVGIEPYELPESTDVEGVEIVRSEWTRR
jgi:hypothetical protein